MSKKDFDEYYKQLTDQYLDIIEQLNSFEKRVEENMVEPERLDILKETFQPIIDNYKMISWVAFLLNKPTKEKKAKKYEKMTKKKYSQIETKFSKEGLLSQGEQILQLLEKEIAK